jgi:plastocyanin
VTLARRRHRALVLAGALGGLLVGALATPALGDDDSGLGADGPVVEVGAEGENRYAPASVTVEPDEPVTFVWVGGGHSVTHQADGRDFDSHPDCRESEVLGVPRDCGGPGTTEEVALDEPGTYEFGCRIHDDMTGTITVEAASADTDDGSSDEGGGSDGSGSEAGSDGSGGEGGSDEEASGDGGAGEGTASRSSADGSPSSSDESDESDESDGDDEERQRAADAMAGFSPERSEPADIGEAPVPDDDLRQSGDMDGMLEPEVDEPDEDEQFSLQGLPHARDGEAEDPDLEPFPEAEEPTPDDEVALPAQDGGDRTIPIALASLGVLGTGAAVLRQVMVGA